MVSIKKEFYKTVIVGVILALSVLVILYHFITEIITDEKLSSARLEAKTVIYYRHYLSLVAPKVKIIDKNLSFFAITPAYVTDRVAKMLRKDNFYVKQVSDNYRDIANKPNKIELEAIKYFKTHKNKDEFFLLTYNNDIKGKYFFYAKKLVIEKSCLKCHGVPFKDVPAKLYYKIVKIYGNRAFGYKEGDVRGIISIIFPYENVVKSVNKIFAIIIGIGAVFFIIGFFIFFRVNDKIKKDITKILNHFKFTKEGRYPILKDKMFFSEFDTLKKQINKTFFRLKKYQGSVYHKYYFHPLTNIPNRNKFLEKIKEEKHPIVLINVDKFKEINFYFGSDIGDKLVKSIGERLKKLKKEYKFYLFHIDIDEFAILFKDKNISSKKIEEIVEKILEILEEPYYIDQHKITIRFRAGISFYKKDYIKADIALDFAKELRKDILFAKDIKGFNKYKERLECLKRLQWILKNDMIVPFYQPIVDKDGKIVKYETLMRIKDENGNIINPGVFLDIAKKSRLYLQFTQKIIEKAIDKIIKKDVSLSVNLTLEDVEDEGMRKFILEKVDLIKDKSKITFEIVESEDVRENESVVEFIKELKSLGCLIYIDDFGSGYSNFDYVIKLHMDGIKIDGSLIKNILKDKNSQIIVKTIVTFSKELNIATVAEFVEDKETFEYLKKLGIDYFQGYYFSPPKEDI